MKFNVYTISFQEQLNPGQKQIIESAFDAAKADMLIKIDTRLDNIAKVRNGWRGKMLERMPGGVGIDALNRLEIGRLQAKNNLGKWFSFEWIDASTMKLYYCSEKLKGLPIIDESRIVNGLKKFIFPDMELSAEPKIEKIEIEREI